MTDLVDTDNLTVVQREDLVGQHIGETTQQTSKIIQQASGGTLLVDEAYRLVPEDAGRDFGPEALETLMRAMSGDSETATNSPSIILAGYIEPMDRVINANPGLARRISDAFIFPNYSVAELVDIMFNMCSKQKYNVTATKNDLVTIINENFSEDTLAKHNAGFSVRLQDVAKKCQDRRMSQLIMSTDKNVTEKELMTLSMDDFTEAMSSVKTQI